MPSTVAPAGAPPTINRMISVRKGPVLTLHPETLRCTGYAAFWMMVIIAMITTRAAVDIDYDDTPLIDMFGYNNICLYWDYSPAREVAAMFYPAVEFPLLGYLLMSHLHVWSSWSQKLVTRRFLLIDRFLVVIEVVLLSWFRMIFVVHATPDTIKGHTYGFLGLQILLCIVALKNFVYFHKLHMSPLAIMQKRLGCGQLLGEKGQDIVGGLYVILLILATAFKITFCLTLFAGNPIIDPKPEGGSGRKIAQMADMIWMILAAVIPAITAFFQRKHTDKVHIALGFDDSSVLGLKGENEGLLVETGTTGGA